MRGGRCDLYQRGGRKMNALHFIFLVNKWLIFNISPRIYFCHVSYIYAMKRSKRSQHKWSKVALYIDLLRKLGSKVKRFCFVSSETLKFKRKRKNTFRKLRQETNFFRRKTAEQDRLTQALAYLTWFQNLYYEFILFRNLNCNLVTRGPESNIGRQEEQFSKFWKNSKANAKYCTPCTS
jgi:hypothetical protein